MQEKQTPPKEIERKFLLKTPLTEELLDSWPMRSKIVQGFLCIDEEKVIRIRIENNPRSFGDEATLTVKGRSSENGITRTEIETTIDVVKARQLLDTFGGSIIEKTRFKIPCYGVVWEVDQFHGDNAGLWVAEVELESEDQGIVKPSWVGEEVSHDPKYTNAALSKKPFKTW